MKKIALLLLVTITFVSCSKSDDHLENSVKEFPESLVNQDKPLGTVNIDGQTPININASFTEKISTLDPIIHYGAITLSNIENTEDNLKVNLSQADKTDNFITIKGNKYELQQFHFHYHSEHSINGEYGVMEIHFVHKSSKGAYAVLGVLVKNGKANTSLQTLFDGSPKLKGTNALSNLLNLNTLLPVDTNKYYAYSGSLTTPHLDFTLNEGPLTWFVFKNQIEMTNDQFKNYQGNYSKENFRVIQPLNNRKIFENIR
ncbi:carbonic anhydrase family protein [Flavobacterium sp. FlaQc-50]|uniref:carbonic anhydrase family protein n=1 Tax=unclassified Flavobacterium TaxID=196869 RepID=UPI0037576B25